MLGSILSGHHSDYILKKLSKKNDNGEKIVSEMRLQAAVPSFFLMPTGYLIYGWTTEKSVGVYAPLIGLFICMFTHMVVFFRWLVLKNILILLDAAGQMWAFTPTSVYLVDSKPGKIRY